MNSNSQTVVVPRSLAERTEAMFRSVDPTGNIAIEWKRVLSEPSGPAEGVSELARHWANVDLRTAADKRWPTDCIHLAREVLRLAGAQSEAVDSDGK